MFLLIIRLVAHPVVETNFQIRGILSVHVNINVVTQYVTLYQLFCGKYSRIVSIRSDLGCLENLFVLTGVLLYLYGILYFAFYHHRNSKS